MVILMLPFFLSLGGGGGWGGGGGLLFLFYFIFPPYLFTQYKTHVYFQSKKHRFKHKTDR